VDKPYLRRSASSADAASKVASDTGSDQCRPTLREVMSGGEPRAWDSDDERRGWYAGYDAAVDEAERKVASDTGAGLGAAAQFLSDRLDELEWMDDDLEATLRDFMGHVDPAHARLKSA
jgi:hypothetical protein